MVLHWIAFERIWAYLRSSAGAVGAGLNGCSGLPLRAALSVAMDKFMDHH